MRALALLALFLSGCAWEQVYSPAEQIRVFRLENPTEVCRKLGLSPMTYACSLLDGKLCAIFVPENAPQWVIEHEIRHCLGWTHG